MTLAPRQKPAHRKSAWLAPPLAGPVPQVTTPALAPEILDAAAEHARNHALDVVEAKSASRALASSGIVYDVLIEAWAMGRAYDYESLTAAFTRACNRSGGAPVHVDDARVKLRGTIYQWRTQDRAAVQQSADGARHAVWYVNLTGAPADAATLGTLARAYLGAGARTNGDRQRFRTALRTVLDLPRLANDARILAAADRVPASRLYDLPAQLAQMTEGDGKKDGDNRRSVLRAAMRWGARARVIPVVFPAAVAPSDHWTAVADGILPRLTARVGNRVRVARSGMRKLGEAARALFGDDLTPESLTPEQADAAVLEIRCGQGDLRGVDQARAALRALRDAGVGQLAGYDPLREFEVDTPHGRKPAIYLRALDGSAESGSWDGALKVLEEAGLPAETMEYLRWHGRYVSLPKGLPALEKKRWPELPKRHRLSRGGLVERGSQLRAFVGVAIYLCKLDATTLTPGVLFGERLEEVADTLADWWGRRRAVLLSLNQTRGAGVGGGLHQITVTAGIAAHHYYVHSRHSRGRPAALGRQHALDETPAEAAAHAGYWYSRKAANDLKDQKGVVAETMSGRKGTADSTTANAPEFKNLKRMWTQTPRSWWLRVLDNLHGQIRRHVEEDRERDVAFHHLVQDAFELGLFMSTGFRGEEAIRLTLTRHWLWEESGRVRLELAAWERKNNKSQSAYLQPRYVPDDVRRLYLEETRPWLMRGQHEARATVAVGRATRANATGVRARYEADAARHAAQIVPKHEFLVVNREGSAYGNVPEAEMELMSARHGEAWKVAMGWRVAEAGLRVPPQSYEFGRHVIRGVMGYWVFQRRRGGGPVAAANYLGDTIETVQTAYSRIDGMHVDSQDADETEEFLLYDNVEMRPSTAAKQTAPPGGNGDALGTVNRILDLIERGVLDKAAGARALAAVA